jgi:hypothetical protein
MRCEIREQEVPRNFARIRLSMIAMVGAIVITSSAAADPVQVALIESLTGNSSKIERMDYLQPGEVIRLGGRDILVLTHLTSCVRETIRGGVVTIGTDASDVQSGEVVRTRSDCASGKILLTGAQTAIAGRSFRGSSH